MTAVYVLGVVRFYDIKQEALVVVGFAGVTELSEGLVEVAGVERRTVKMHNAASVIDSYILQNGTKRRAAVNDNGLSLQIVSIVQISFNSNIFSV